MGIASLSTFITENKESILSEWEAFARTLAQGSSMDVAALRDHADVMLDAIAADIDAPQTDTEQSDKSRGLQQDSRRDSRAAIVAGEHGRERAGRGFTVVEMMAEFRALRASVTRLWLAQSSEFGRGEVQALIRFDEAVDQAIAYSLERFARDVDDTQQRFLAILSHDLRNPLAAVSTAANFLTEMGNVSGEDAKLVSTIQRATTRMTHLVADMLELALGGIGGKMSIHRKAMNAGDAVNAAVSEIRASYAAPNIDVTTQGDLTGQWDAARLAQALTNLIGNALQHGDRRRPIHIASSGGDGEVAIEVRNSGPTIPAERLRHIFDGPKAGDRTRGDRRHLGLGLFIVCKIVESHGGSIDAHSENGETSFRIRLPREAQTVVPTAA